MLKNYVVGTPFKFLLALFFTVSTKFNPLGAIKNKLIEKQALGYDLGFWGPGGPVACLLFRLWPETFG